MQESLQTLDSLKKDIIYEITKRDEQILGSS